MKENRTYIGSICNTQGKTFTPFTFQAPIFYNRKILFRNNYFS